MSCVELIDELTGICIRQAEIIRAQALVIEQFGAQATEDPEIAVRLQQLVGNTDNTKRGAWAPLFVYRIWQGRRYGYEHGIPNHESGA